MSDFSESLSSAPAQPATENETAGIFCFLVLALKSEVFLINYFQNALLKGYKVITRMTGDVVYYQCQV